MLRIVTRENVTRAFFFALKEIAAEQQRCERVLGLLLPPTLVSTSTSYTCTIISNLFTTINLDTLSKEQLGSGAEGGSRELGSLAAP